MPNGRDGATFWNRRRHLGEQLSQDFSKSLSENQVMIAVGWERLVIERQVIFGTKKRGIDIADSIIFANMLILARFGIGHAVQLFIGIFGAGTLQKAPIPNNDLTID